jgi:outer membrane autotransporter protein
MRVCFATALVAILSLFVGVVSASTQELTTTNLQISPSPSYAGRSASISVVVSSAQGVPAGNVAFSIDGQFVATAALTNAQATINHVFPSVGPAAISADYNGSPQHLPSNGSTVHDVQHVPTTTTLMSSANPSNGGEPVTFTASVVDIGGLPVSGEVVFSVDFQQQPATPLVNGQASLTVQDLAAGDRQIFATFLGDQTLASSFAGLVQTVSPVVVIPVVVASSAPNPSTPGETVTFTAVVSARSVPVPIEGSVDFFIDGASNVVPIVDGVATLTKSNLALGIHSVDVVTENMSAPGVSYIQFLNGRTSFVHTVAHAPKQPSVTTITSSPNPSELGQLVTITASVETASGQPADGTVNIVVAGRSQSRILTGGSASIELSDLAPGPYRIEAYFAGNAGTLESYAQATHVVNTPVGVPTVTTLAATPSPSEVNQPISLTATVTSSGGVPTGMVQFEIDGQASGAVPLVSGVAQLAVPSLPEGEHSFSALFQPDAPFAPSIAQISHPVIRVPTATEIMSSSASVTLGTPVTVTATTVGSDVLGNVPTGFTTFSVDEATIATIPIVGGVASTPLNLGIGSHMVTATYSGDAVFAPSSSSYVQTVNPNIFPTVTQVSSSPNPSNFGEPVTFSVSVQSPTTNFVLEGNVSLRIDDVVVQVPLEAGSGTFTRADLGVGEHTVIAAYGGESDFGVSQAEIVHVVVLPVDTRTWTTVAASPSPSVEGQEVSFFANVVAANAVPTGAVSFSINGAPAGVFPVADGVAVMTTSELEPGDYTVTADFTADQPYVGSSASTIHHVDPAIRDTSVDLVSSANPSLPGQSVTVTAQVSSTNGQPEGLVSFSIDGANAGQVVLANGQAAFDIGALVLGEHVIIASYAGSARYAASQSQPLIQVVAVHPDSVALGATQIMLTKVAAQASGQAISGAIDAAVSDALSNAPGGLDVNAGGMRFSYAPAARDDEHASRTSALDGLIGSTTLAQRARAAADALAGQTIDPGDPVVSYAAEPSRWRMWTELRASVWRARDGGTNLEGDQINFLAGADYSLSSDFIIGLFGGYEDFDHQALNPNGRLEGQGWTAGGYLGWRFAPGWRFDAGLARSQIDYQASSGAALGAFGGERWLFQSGLTGSMAAGGFLIEPSARTYVLWENENAYVDSLGATHLQRDFSTGRASVGAKASYPIELDNLSLSPFVGLFADYYFSQDNAAANLATPDVIEDGLSTRLIFGAAITFKARAQLSLTGEVGGLGDGGAPHGVVKGRLNVRF